MLYIFAQRINWRGPGSEARTYARSRTAQVVLFQLLPLDGKEHDWLFTFLADANTVILNWRPQKDFSSYLIPFFRRVTFFFSEQSRETLSLLVVLVQPFQN